MYIGVPHAKPQRLQSEAVYSQTIRSTVRNDAGFKGLSCDGDRPSVAEKGNTHYTIRSEYGLSGLGIAWENVRYLLKSTIFR
ncbi:hypothetical protein BaRGS_00018367, partial [Batillaria attramentaria]